MWNQQSDPEWIASVCRQLSRVTGWPTTFASLEALEARRGDEYTWACDVHSADGRIGALTVSLPHDRPLDGSFLRACEAADLTAQLIQRGLMGTSKRPRISPPQGDPLPVSIRRSCGDDEAADSWTRAVHRVLDVGLRLTSFRAAVLFVVDPDDGRLRLRGQRCFDHKTVILFNRPLEEAPFDLAALHREPVVIRRRDRDFSEWLPDGMSLGVCRGVPTSQGLQGTLWAFDRRDRRLTARDELVLDSLTTRLSELIEQSRQIAAGALQRRLQAELKIAAESQPQQLVSLQGAGGWCRIAGRTESACEVGGDLCEVIPLGDERMLVAIGDAAGHSIPAAMVMSTVRGALRVIVDPQAAEPPDLEEILQRLNTLLHAIVESHQFMTLTCALFDGQSSTMQLCSAGHPPALRMRQGGVDSIDARGLLLGVVEDAIYQSQTINLEPGDVLAFYSDGISEAPARSRELFGLERIASVLTAQIDSSPEAIVDQVWTELQSHRDPGHTDDRTLLVVRYDGVPAQTSSLAAM